MVAASKTACSHLGADAADSVVLFKFTAAPNGAMRPVGVARAGLRATLRSETMPYLSIIVQDRAEAAVLGEQRIAAEVEQVQVDGLVGLLFAVGLDHDRDGFRGLTGGEGDGAGLGDVVVVARRGGAVRGATALREETIHIACLASHSAIKF